MKINSTLITKAKLTTNKGRYYELDSLRGLAALTVMTHHILLVFPSFSLPYAAPMPSLVHLIRFTPLGIIMAGREAVIFFFVLSGFVHSAATAHAMVIAESLIWSAVFNGRKKWRSARPTDPASPFLVFS